LRRPFPECPPALRFVGCDLPPHDPDSGGTARQVRCQLDAKLSAVRYGQRFRRTFHFTVSEAWRQKLQFWLSAIIVGAVSVVFGLGTDKAIGLFHFVTRPRPLVVFVLCPVGLAVVSLITRKLFPGAQGSGIPQAMAALHLEKMEGAATMLSWRIAIGKVLLTLVGFACGASIGKEGPTVQIGCSVMYGVGRLGLKPSPEFLRLLVLAGGAAGITGAFNTPVAGAVFAIEEMAHYQVNPLIGSRLLTATALSGMTMLALVGYYSYFGSINAAMPWGWNWLAVLCIGAAGGLLGGAFSRILTVPILRYPRFLSYLVRQQPTLFAAMCGLALAMLGALSHGQVFCSSHSEAQQALYGNLLLPKSFTILKWAATIVSYMSGIPGGIFAPSLAAGAGISAWFAPLFPHVPLSALAMLSMAAYFSGVVQSPITAAVIVLEMTNNIEMTVAVSAASMLGTAFSHFVCPKPIYAAMAGQFLEVVKR
jgi:H+/Cl- antiporter ClcA